MTVGRSASARLPVVLMVVLTAATGIVDAVGYLGLDRVFAGNMTGNVVVLGMGAAGADHLPVLGPGIALAGFVAGAGVAGLLASRTGSGREARPGWTTPVSMGLLGVAVVLGVCAVVLHGTTDASPVRELGVTAGLAAAMGAQAALARRIAVADMPTVVITSTLTALVTELGRDSGGRRRWPRRLIAVTALGAGATAGAALVPSHAPTAIIIAAALTAAVAVTGYRVRSQ